MAQGRWTSTLQEACAILRDPQLLAKVGFDTSFSDMPLDCSTTGPEVAAQDALAEQAMTYLLHLLLHR
eukprot:2594582-Lingulodinium_polyedra.AAC.1